MIDNKAGLIPFINDNGIIKMLFMVSSDPKFGGPKPMISKGTIEEGETPLETSIREAEEELGLFRDNIGYPFKVWEGDVKLTSCSYYLTVYAAEVSDKKKFGKWCDETKFTTWMTYDSFMEKGRRDHKHIVEILNDMLKEW